MCFLNRDSGAKWHLIVLVFYSHDYDDCFFLYIVMGQAERLQGKLGSYKKKLNSTPVDVSIEIDSIAWSLEH